ncbi:glycoside hydrolase family 5 protein [Cylindrobasidium torrendii FP15055 ss-10]|uniref:Glycoside hydrolase family 5 protein n=1 Tax=Cylindrobasidium torrendii FP15055 ss-10 TaxID=1314674 RepID=A0A0D7BDL5_9AGAR|nr:glycoside hydrolase family 5 protein [Cylindrobasidium torrendii FP15055 ss-10]
MSFLHVSGTDIVNENGAPVVLRGAGLGGWMMMENFISGFPGCEYQIRDSLADVLGKERAEFFFDKFLENFFTDADAAFFQSLGLNCIRIAVSYRHFEDDSNPGVLKPSGLAHLDRAIKYCAAHSIYTIIDVHTAPGGQSGGWHADGGTHIPLFWRHKNLQDRFVWLWEILATHYVENPWVAGYNLLNEPADPHPTQARLTGLYDRLCAAIRAIDDKHIIFLDGNTFASDFSKFPDNVRERWGENVAYAIHDYSPFGFPNSPEVYVGSEEQKARMKATYERKRKWMDERGLCVWNGEWGPVYARKAYDGDTTEEINRTRYQVLNDQLKLYGKDKLSWSIWLYKDIGFQGMVYVSPDTPYMKTFEEFLAKKHRLAADAWGADDKNVKDIYTPIIEHVKDMVSDESKRKLYPPLWTVEGRVTRITRTILLAEYLVAEWAEIFRGMNDGDLERLAKSFHFDNCLKRDGLNKILRDNAS